MKPIKNTKVDVNCKEVALLIILCVLCNYVNFGQSPEKNYIIRTELLDTIKDPGLISELEDGQKIDIIEYYDGLGRLTQTNSYHASPLAQDIVQHIEYDTLGRQKFNFLPFPAEADGAFLAESRNLTVGFYSSRSDITVPVTSVPFGETEFDNSPREHRPV
jgi:hypothetical protein